MLDPGLAFSCAAGGLLGAFEPRVGRQKSKANARRHKHKDPNMVYSNWYRICMVYGIYVYIEYMVYISILQECSAKHTLRTKGFKSISALVRAIEAC